MLSLGIVDDRPVGVTNGCNNMDACGNIAIIIYLIFWSWCEHANFCETFFQDRDTSMTLKRVVKSVPIGF